MSVANSRSALPHQSVESRYMRTFLSFVIGAALLLGGATLGSANAREPNNRSYHHKHHRHHRHYRRNKLSW
jgi:hypothetical protein